MAANEDFFLRLEIWWRFCRWKRFPIQQGHRVGKLREYGARPRNSPKHARKPATISTMRNLRSWSRFVTKICSQTVMSRQNDQKVFFQHKNSAGHAARASNWLTMPWCSIDFLLSYQSHECQGGYFGHDFLQNYRLKLFQISSEYSTLDPEFPQWFTCSSDFSERNNLS